MMLRAASERLGPSGTSVPCSVRLTTSTGIVTVSAERTGEVTVSTSSERTEASPVSSFFRSSSSTTETFSNSRAHSFGA